MTEDQDRPEDIPKAFAKPLLQILYWGLLRIRSQAHADGIDRCFREADHLHNLPNLIANYTPELLLYYWEVERVCYIEASDSYECQQFQEFWTELEAAMIEAGLLNRD